MVCATTVNITSHAQVKIVNVMLMELGYTTQKVSIMIGNGHVWIMISAHAIS